MKVDPAVPTWKPAPVTSEHEDELRLVGADTLDEICFGWAKIFRRTYPDLSVTLALAGTDEAMPGLVNAKADLAPTGHEMVGDDEKAFIDKFGYEPFGIKVATGSLLSPAVISTMVVVVDRDNPIQHLSFAELDAIYSTSRKRGHADIRTWGDLGLTGAWHDRPIHTYGVRPQNGIAWFFNLNVMQRGEWKSQVEVVKGSKDASGTFVSSFNVVAREMQAHPGGLSYSLLKDVKPNQRIVPISDKDGGPFVLPTRENVYGHQYPFSRFVYIYVNRKPGTALEPKVKEFLRMVLSQQGQGVIAQEGVHMPLTPAVLKEELAKLD
jgi:phosphate transport system substrate-binding protein